MIRVKTEKGWISYVSANGDLMVEKVPKEDLPLVMARKNVHIPSLEKKIWKNFIDSLDKPTAKTVKEHKSRAENKKATPMTKRGHHDNLKKAVEFAKRGGFSSDEMHIIRTAHVIDVTQEGGKWCRIQYLDPPGFGGRSSSAGAKDSISESPDF